MEAWIVFISVTFSFYSDVNYSNFDIVCSSIVYLLKNPIIFYLGVPLFLSSIQNIDLAPRWVT